MRYFVTIGEETIDVDLSNGRVTIAGRVVDAEMREVPGTLLRHLLVDGQSWPLVAQEGAVRGEWDIHLDGMRVRATVVDERTRAIREMTGQSAESLKPRPLRAPMPGLIVRVEVGHGQPVRPGDGLVIIEAMKMENELRAEARGIVSRVHVAAGEAVQKGAVLVEFDSAG